MSAQLYIISLVPICKYFFHLKALHVQWMLTAIKDIVKTKNASA